MKVLVLGENGQLARHLRRELPQAVFWGRGTLDLAGDRDVAGAIARFAPSLIVNAAAYTAVDKAESKRTLAWSINAKASATVAQAASILGVPLLHVSTDYVFDGSKTSEYSTDDPVGPINVYGATKLAGELAVRTLCQSSWIVRTSWVFSEFGDNFARSVLCLATTRNSLRVVDDQHGRPTYAGDIAKAIARILSRSGTENRVNFGVYHATGGPIVSRFQFAEEILRCAHQLHLLETRPKIRAIGTADYPTIARRPPNSALLPSDEIGRAIGAAFDWPSSLNTMMKRIADDRQMLSCSQSSELR